jgi:hypothetical protein
MFFALPMPRGMPGIGQSHHIHNKVDIVPYSQMRKLRLKEEEIASSRLTAQLQCGDLNPNSPDS